MKNRFSNLIGMLGAVFVPTSFQGRIEFKKHPLTEQQIIHVTKIKSSDDISQLITEIESQMGKKIRIEEVSSEEMVLSTQDNVPVK